LLEASNSNDNIISSEEIGTLGTDLSQITQMREELDEHLQAINENTNELDIQNSYICEIDNRLTKIEEKMDELHFLLKQLVTRAKLSVELGKDEQRVFLILYTHSKFMTTEELGCRSMIDKFTAEEAITSMMDKGIPIDREIFDGNVYFRMNKEFKLRQAKEHVIKIDTDVTSQFQNMMLKQFFST
jgi:predicted transcriptional regulator